MGLSHSPRIVTDGLIFCIDPGNKRSYPRSGSTIHDLVGSNNCTMTNMNGNNFSSDKGGYLSFDGTNETVSLSTTLPSSTVYTVSCWFSCNDVGFAGSLFGFGTSTSNTQTMYFYGVAAFCSLPAGGGFGTNNWSCECWGISGASDILRGTGFHHLVATFNDANVTANKMWIDGEEQSMSDVGQNNANNSEPLSNQFKLACNGWTTSSNLWNGDISHCSIYNRILTDDEVQQSYLASKWRFQ